MHGLEEEVMALVQEIADIVGIDENSTMNEDAARRLVKRATIKNTDLSNKVVPYGAWLVKNNLTAFKIYDFKKDGAMDRDAMIFSVRAFLHESRAKTAALEANPDHFIQAAASMRSNREKVHARRMRRHWMEVMQAILVKHHALDARSKAFSMREMKQKQTNMARVINSCADETLTSVRECIEQVMAAHKLVMKNAQRFIAGKMKDPNAPELLQADRAKPFGRILSHAKVREARKVFYKYAGPDARLDVDELSTCARKLGIFGLTDKEVESLFNGLDMNHNGFVDLGEFLELFNCLVNDERRT